METKKYEIGDVIEWETLNGEHHTGQITDIDSNDAIVNCAYHGKCVCSDVV